MILIRLTPNMTKDVVIQGVTFTLRPWMAYHQIAMAEANRTGGLAELARVAVNACVVGWKGEGMEPFSPENIDRLPGDVYSELFVAAQEISTLTEDERRV